MSKYAAAGDFLVKRDGKGELLPVDVTLDSGSVVRVYPMTYGDAEEFASQSDDLQNISADKVAELFDRFLHTPRWDDITGEFLRQHFRPFAVQELLQAILRGSDLDAKSVQVGEDGSARVQLEGNSSIRQPA